MFLVSFVANWMFVLVAFAMSVMGEPSFAAWTAQRSLSSGFGGNLTVVDKVPPEMLYLVDPHWYKFPPLNPLWHSILGFVIGVLGFVSITGNGMVIYIFSTTKPLRTPSNLLVVNLAFSDFFMMLSMSPAMVINCYNETWVLGRRCKRRECFCFDLLQLFLSGPFMCQLYAMMGSLFGCVSIWTMTMIAFDRYNVIVKGLSAKPMSIKGALLKIFLIYAFSILWTIAPMFGWNRYVPEGNMTACGTDYLTTDWLSRSYILVYSIFVYFLPLLTIIYSYWFIVQVKTVSPRFGRQKHLQVQNVARFLSGSSCSRKSNARSSEKNERSFAPIVRSSTNKCRM